MSKKLWTKSNAKLNSLVEKFTIGDDLLFDQKLVAYDVYGSLAHTKMLNKIGIVSNEEFSKLKIEFKKILKKYEAGKYKLQPGDEDVHSRIEEDITKVLPKIGGKIHTARSRNDQVLVDTRLYSKDSLSQIIKESFHLTQFFVDIANKHEFVPMPGYTHMQRAMLSSVGMWAGSFAESLLDDIKILETAYKINDQSPLGSGAAYGVSVAIDRQMTADLLGFSKVQNNSLYCQNSKGKIEANIVHSLSQLMMTLSKFASDLLLFSTSEFDFFSLSDDLTTGSSIMPQKKNLDLMELLRAKARTVQSYEMQIMSVMSSLPSGYNRDSQEIKSSLFKSFEIALDSIGIVALTLGNLKINEDKLLLSIDKSMFAAHHAYELVENKKIPFREAYKLVGQNLNLIPNYDPKKIIKESKHLGSTNNLQLEKIESEVDQGLKTWQIIRDDFFSKLSKLIN